jgi:ribosomal protein L11 methyltransferase
MFVWTKRVPQEAIPFWENQFTSETGLVITQEPQRNSARVEVYFDERAAAEKFRNEQGGSIRKVTPQNWAAMQPEVPPPVKVRDRLLICAETDQARLRKLAQKNPQRDLINIPADLAFGTGHHATTATVLRLLVDFAETREEKSWTLLDLGTGTGVLAIAAEKLGAASVWGCDFDPLAVRVAQKNLSRNRTRRVVIDQADVLKWKPRERFDCVAANLFSDVLEAAFPKIVRSVKRDGIVLVSGILKSQADHCLRTGERAGLRFDKVITRGKWVTALGVLR